MQKGSTSSVCNPRRLKLVVVLGILKVVVVYFIFFYSGGSSGGGGVTFNGSGVEDHDNHELQHEQHKSSTTHQAEAEKDRAVGGIKVVSIEQRSTSSPPPSSVEDTDLIVVNIHLEGYGDLKWKLFPKEAPRTVANFVKLAKNKIFDGTCLYRYEAGFVLQGGGGGSIGRRSSPYGTIPLEHNLPNKKWSVAMARTGDPNSATMEFFINLNDNSHWLGAGGATKEGYAVFGEVVEGFAVIEEMGKKPTKHEGLTMFVDPVKILKVEIE